MFAITGVTGQVGGATARHLLKAGRSVRAVLRDEAKAAPWKALGAEIAIADLSDAAALQAAFADAEGVFVMVPPDFAPDPGFTGARKASAALAAALAKQSPANVVALSSVGAQKSDGLGLITQVRILEEALAPLDIPTAILRPAWFMENSLWDIAPARETGELSSFLQPLDRPIPMVATADIGQIAAYTLMEQWSGRRVIEIEGPQRYSQTDIASLLSTALGRRVEAHAVPRPQWEARFRAQGTDRPAARLDMLDGFNSGWIDFEPNTLEHIIGKTAYATVLADLVKRVP